MSGSRIVWACVAALALAICCSALRVDAAVPAECEAVCTQKKCPAVFTDNKLKINGPKDESGPDNLVALTAATKKKLCGDDLIKYLFANDKCDASCCKLECHFIFYANQFPVNDKDNSRPLLEDDETLKAVMDSKDTSKEAAIDKAIAADHSPKLFMLFQVSSQISASVEAQYRTAAGEIYIWHFNHQAGHHKVGMTTRDANRRIRESIRMNALGAAGLGFTIDYTCQVTSTGVQSAWAVEQGAHATLAALRVPTAAVKLLFSVIMRSGFSEVFNIPLPVAQAAVHASFLALHATGTC